MFAFFLPRSFLFGRANTHSVNAMTLFAFSFRGMKQQLLENFLSRFL